MESSKRIPLNNTQKQLLVEFLSTHPELRSGNFTATFTKKKAQKLWEEIAVNLNSVPNGAKKSWLQWRKTWQDQKKNTKAKLVKNKKYTSGTGGGPAPDSDHGLNEYETEVAALINPTTVKGDDTILESRVTFSFSDKENNVGTILRNKDVGNEPHQTTEPPQPTIHTSNQAISVEHNIEECGQLIPANTASETVIDQNIPSTSKSKPNVRLNRVGRLNKSMDASEKLLTSCQQRTECLEKYQKGKLLELKRRRISRSKYQTQKIELLRERNEIQGEMLQN